MSRSQLEYNTYTGPIFKKWRQDRTHFIETGTNFGDGVYTAVDVGYTNIQSVELDNVLFNEVIEKFKPIRDKIKEKGANITFYHGRSDQYLKQMLEALGDEPGVIWLDAHNADHGEIALVELQIILESGINRNSTIIIDDIPYIGNDIDRCKRLIMDINPDYVISYEDTIQKNYVLVAHV